MNIYKLARTTVDIDPARRKKALSTLAGVADIWALHLLTISVEDEQNDEVKKLAIAAKKHCESTLIKRILRYIPGLRKGTGNVKDTVSEALYSGNEKVQTAAIQSISLSRNVGLIDTIGHLANKASSVRVITECLKSLGFMGQKKEAFILTGFTTHPEKHVRSAALVALSMIDKSLTWSLVIEFAASSGHLAAEAIAIIHSLRTQRLESIFRFMLNSPDEKKAEVAIKVIAKLGDSPHLKLLEQVVTGPNKARRLKAITVLKILEQKKIDESSQILKLAIDSEPVAEPTTLSTELPDDSPDSAETPIDQEKPSPIPVPDTFMQGLSMLSVKGPEGIAQSAENDIDFSWADVQSSLAGGTGSEQLQSALSLSSENTEEPTDSAGKELEQARKAILSHSLESQVNVSAARAAIQSQSDSARDRAVAFLCMVFACIFYLAPVCILSGAIFTLHLAQRRDLLSEPLWTIPPLLVIIGLIWMLVPNDNRRNYAWLSKTEQDKLNKVVRSAISRTGISVEAQEALIPGTSFKTEDISTLPLLPFKAGTRIGIGAFAIPSLSVHELKINLAWSLLYYHYKDGFASRYIATFLQDTKWIIKAYSRDGSKLNPLCWYASFVQKLISSLMAASYLKRHIECDQQCASLYGSNIMAQTWTSMAILEQAEKTLDKSGLKNASSATGKLYDFLEDSLTKFIKKRGQKVKEQLLASSAGPTPFVPPLAERLAVIAREKVERTRVIRPAASLFYKIDEAYDDLSDGL